MQTAETLNPQYVVDKDGRRTGVLLSVEAFEALLDALRPVVGREPTEAEWQRAASETFEALGDADVYSADDGVPFRL